MDRLAFTIRVAVGTIEHSIHWQGEGYVEVIGHMNPTGALPILLLDSMAQHLVAEGELIAGDPMDVDADLDPSAWRTRARAGYLLIRHVFGAIGEVKEIFGDRPVPPPWEQEPVI